MLIRLDPAVRSGAAAMRSPLVSRLIGERGSEGFERWASESGLRILPGAGL